MNKELKPGMIIFKDETRKDGVIRVKELEVENVARKYLHIKGEKTKVEIETMRHEDEVYSQSSFQTYLTKQEIYDHHEFEAIRTSLRKMFDWGGGAVHCTIEQLREVAKILGIVYKPSIEK